MISQDRVVFVCSEAEPAFELSAFGTSCTTEFHGKRIFNHQLVYLIGQIHVKEFYLAKIECLKPVFIQASY